MNRRAFPPALVLAAFVCAAAAQAAPLLPVDAAESVEIEVGGNRYVYFPLTAGEPMTIEVEGPSLFEAIVRGRFTGSTSPFPIEIAVLLDGRPLWTTVLRSETGSSVYPAHPGWSVGRPDDIKVDIPAGTHTVELRLVRPARGTVDVNPVRRELDVLPWRLAWEGGLGTTYDSNVYRYSDEDREEYLDGLRVDRYPMDALDDLRLETDAEIELIREEPDERETSLRFSGRWRLYTVNGDKSFSMLSARLLETRPGLAYLRAEYSAIPSYRIRPLWDEDSGEYRGCDYRKHGVSLELGSDRSLPVDVRASWGYDAYRYDPDFIEYDANASTYGLRLVIRPAAGLRIDLGYELRQSLARGTDEEGEVRSLSDDSDATYDQDAWEGRVRWRAGRLEHGSLILTGRVRHARRYFLTSHEPDEDPYHRGREDRFWTVAAGADVPVGSGLTLEGFLEYRSRTSNSEVVESIGGVKDYTDYRAGMAIIVEGVRFLD
ncbi:MAG: hypothetical protein GF405_03555 [Candidatus Eisenbacteria bacterium]|nr:hypothetical protein [Candidatus Eisenbacteria bacterium]